MLDCHSCYCHYHIDKSQSQIAVIACNATTELPVGKEADQLREDGTALIHELVAIVRKRLGLDASLYQILQILSLTLFEKTPILCAFQRIDEDANFTENANQLILFDF